MRTKREAGWRAALLLALCSGLSFYLTTGRGTVALVIAALLACFFMGCALFLPRHPRWGPKDFYWVALVVLVLPWVLLKIGYPGRSGRGSRPAWHDLRARYAATGPAPAALDQCSDVVVTRVRGFSASPYGYTNVCASLSDAGSYLAPSFPLSMLYGPVRVPVNGIWRCRKDPPQDPNTTLSIRDVEMEITLPDEGGRILQWCVRQDIPEDVP